MGCGGVSGGNEKRDGNDNGGYAHGAHGAGRYGGHTSSAFGCA